MSLFSVCWDCWTCRCMGHCYAGNGDDDYFPATKEQILCRLSEHKDVSEYDRQHMIDFLKNEYGIEYGNLTGSELLE